MLIIHRIFNEEYLLVMGYFYIVVLIVLLEDLSTPSTPSKLKLKLT